LAPLSRFGLWTHGGFLLLEVNISRLNAELALLAGLFHT
jgi:hypothetical protein